MKGRRFQHCDACVDAIIETVGRRIVLGTPLGIGKPNAMLNALYERAAADPTIHLDIVTALSLNPPLGKSELEERFLRPVRERVWKDYPRLRYLDDLAARRVPANIRVIEFYLQSGSQLHCAVAQQNYISTNYTQVARAMMTRGVNVLLQAVAAREVDGQRRLSLSGNPDVTLQVLPKLMEREEPWVFCAQINRRLPWMGNRAEVEESLFDFVVDDAALDHEPFAVPHEPVNVLHWAIGLRASELVRDGGTLQVGIGALGDAACHALRLRERENRAYAGMLDALGSSADCAAIGGRGGFAEGLFASSEMVSDALFRLFEEGIVRRRVYEDPVLQNRVNHGIATEAEQQGGTALQGAFFLGPADFYRRLRALPEERLALIDMTSVGEVNRVYTNYGLERLQRRHARLVNITMKATLLGAAVSDQLADGQVVSGVGGQFDFVSMAHQLPDARSVLLLQATRGAGKRLESNIVWEYPHTTIPRHLRDLFVTEYGVAELGGKTDAECIDAMLAVADSRFQDSLMQSAKAAGKLPADYRVPEQFRNNLPATVERALRPYCESGHLPSLPFGCDLKEAEIALAARLKKLETAAHSFAGRKKLLAALLAPAPATLSEVAAALKHLSLDRPDSLRERVLARMVRAAYRL